MYRFRGNACEHYTSLNVSGETRVSFDFRVIRSQELPVQPVSSVDDPPAGEARGGRGAREYFQIGRYYKRLADGVA